MLPEAVASGAETRNLGFGTLQANSLETQLVRAFTDQTVNELWIGGARCEFLTDL